MLNVVFISMCFLVVQLTRKLAIRQDKKIKTALHSVLHCIWFTQANHTVDIAAAASLSMLLPLFPLVALCYTFVL